MKTLYYILTISIFILSCDNSKEKVKTHISNPDKLKSRVEQQKKDNGVIDIIFENKNIKIRGDTSINKEKIGYASIIFEPYISFEDFKVSSIDNKSKAKLNLLSNRWGNYFRTLLSEAYMSDTSNFAGHYTFVSWGCGSPCQSSLIIDRQTGKIYDSPPATLDYEFHAYSRMLLVNPPDSTGFYDDCFYCKPIIYVLNEKTKTFIKKKPRK